MITVEYPKIETLYNRNKETFQIIEGEYRIPEFGLIQPDKWILQEKVDGTNIRIQYDGEKVEFGGRTANAQLPADLLSYLVTTFSPHFLAPVFADANPSAPVILFGEGYGPGIQKGGGDYRPSKGFILFDIKVGDWWLEYDDLLEINRQLDGICVKPYSLTLDLIIHAMKEDKLLSLCASSFGKERKSEGIVMRTNPTLRTRRGDRVIAKLKVSDFKPGKR